MQGRGCYQAANGHTLIKWWKPMEVWNTEKQDCNSRNRRECYPSSGLGSDCWICQQESSQAAHKQSISANFSVEGKPLSIVEAPVGEAKDSANARTDRGNPYGPASPGDEQEARPEKIELLLHR